LSIPVSGRAKAPRAGQLVEYAVLPLAQAVTSFNGMRFHVKETMAG
jgi:hypothetical protein